MYRLDGKVCVDSVASRTSKENDRAEDMQWAEDLQGQGLSLTDGPVPEHAREGVLASRGADSEEKESSLTLKEESLLASKLAQSRVLSTAGASTGVKLCTPTPDIAMNNVTIPDSAVECTPGDGKSKKAHGPGIFRDSKGDDEQQGLGSIENKNAPSRGTDGVWKAIGGVAPADGRGSRSMQLQRLLASPLLPSAARFSKFENFAALMASRQSKIEDENESGLYF
jgi:hypothetical protein